jgi:hypothetical protein
MLIKQWFFKQGNFFICEQWHFLKYYIQQYFICLPLDFTAVSEEAGIEHRNVATLELAVYLLGKKYW